MSIREENEEETYCHWLGPDDETTHKNAGEAETEVDRDSMEGTARVAAGEEIEGSQCGKNKQTEARTKRQARMRVDDNQP